jgi:hypothetical protein
MYLSVLKYGTVFMPWKHCYLCNGTGEVRSSTGKFQHYCGNCNRSGKYWEDDKKPDPLSGPQTDFKPDGCSKAFGLAILIGLFYFILSHRPH